MKNEVRLYVDEAMGKYGFPNGHPFGPDRQDASETRSSPAPAPPRKRRSSAFTRPTTSSGSRRSRLTAMDP
jgi:hypothetical protein